jgi:probable addiction module antidote protein
VVSIAYWEDHQKEKQEWPRKRQLSGKPDEALMDSRKAVAYLNAAMEEGDRELFLLALRNVAEAHGGMAAVSEKAKLNRESLYRMLSRKGNPEIKSIPSLLNSMGLKLTVEPKSRRSKVSKVGKAA